MNYRKGFTLMETVVAIGIFTVVFTIGVGGFVSAMRTQRQLQALVSANSNASLVIEQMAREIRTGVNFRISADPCGDSCRLDFQNVKREDIGYWRDASNTLMRSSPTALTGEPVTADNVAVRYLSFKILGHCPSMDTNDIPDHAPRVTIALGVSPRSERGVSEDITQIETTVSSRQGFICAIPALN